MTKMNNFHARDAAGRAYLDPQREFERYQRQKNRVSELRRQVNSVRSFVRAHGPGSVPSWLRDV